VPQRPVLAAYTHLRLAWNLTVDLKRPLGEDRFSAPAYTRTCPSGVSAPPPESGPSRQTTETLPPRTRTTSRPPQPATSTPLRRTHQDCCRQQQSLHTSRTATPQNFHKTAAQRLRLKLEEVAEFGSMPVQCGPGDHVVPP
jgi:hypothetical protein